MEALILRAVESAGFELRSMVCSRRGWHHCVDLEVRQPEDTHSLRAQFFGLTRKQLVKSVFRAYAYPEPCHLAS